MAWSKEPRLCDHLLSLRGGDQSSGYLLTKYVEIASWAKTNHLAQSKLLCEFLTNRIFTSKSLKTNASGCRLQANGGGGVGLSSSGATNSFLRRPQAFATLSACFLSLFLTRKWLGSSLCPTNLNIPRSKGLEWQGELLPERVTSAISIHLTCGQCVACFVVIVEFVFVVVVNFVF